jgi:hypothetical protein
MCSKSCLVLYLLCCFCFVASAQFPFKKGKESTIVIPSISGTKTIRSQAKTLNIDLSDSRFGFSYTTQKIDTGMTPPPPNQFDDKIISNLNMGFALNENSFSLYDETLKPGVDFDWTIMKLKYNPIDMEEQTMSYTSFVAKPFVELKNVKNAEVINSGQLKVNDDNLKADIGISLGHNWYKETTTFGVKHVFSLYSTSGFSFNNEEDLKEKNVVDLSQKYVNAAGDTLIVQSGKKYYIGELENKFFTRITLDAAFMLTTLRESEVGEKKYSNANLFLLCRGAAEYSSASKPKYNFFIGPSITRFSRQVIGSLLFELNDIGSLNYKNDLKDVLKINLYFGIPIPFK